MDKSDYIFQYTGINTDLVYIEMFLSFSIMSNT